MSYRNILHDSKHLITSMEVCKMLSQNLYLALTVHISFKRQLPSESVLLTSLSWALLENHQLCSYSRTSQHFMQLQRSLPCPQDTSSLLDVMIRNKNFYHSTTRVTEMGFSDHSALVMNILVHSPSTCLKYVVKRMFF
jgi:hypothetical protein